MSYSTEPHECDVCHNMTDMWAEDEDESIWCVDCIREWELKHSQDWATGQPL